MKSHNILPSKTLVSKASVFSPHYIFVYKFNIAL